MKRRQKKPRKPIKIPSPAHRLIKRLALGALVALTLLGLVGSFYEIKADHFGVLARKQLESMYNRRIEVGQASVTFLGRVILRDVTVLNPPGYRSRYLMRAPRIDLSMGMTGGDTSAFRPRRVVLEQPEFWFERPENEVWNTQDLWVKKDGVPLPTFRLPIELFGATIHYTDSNVGSSGISLTFEGVDVNYDIVSNGREITTSLSTKGAPLPAGGEMDFSLKVQPARRTAQAEIRIRNADVSQLRPYSDFIKLLRIDSGLANVSHDISFDKNRMAVTGAVHLEGSQITHVPTSRGIAGVDPVVSYQAYFGDSTISIDTVQIRWGSSNLSVRGRATKRNVFPMKSEVVFETLEGYSEDLSFLLSDPRFNASGPVSGSCIFRGWQDTEIAAPEGKYDVAVDLKNSEVRYGDIIHKASGETGTLALAGTAGMRPADIEITLGKSEISITPIKDGWRVRQKSVLTADIPRYLLPAKPLQKAHTGGWITMDVNVYSGGSVAGNIDLTRAEIGKGTVIEKRAGTQALFLLSGWFTDGGFTADNSRITLGNTSATLRGTLSADSMNMEISLPRVYWPDIASIVPAMNSARVRFSGDAAGNFVLRSDSPAGGKGHFSAAMNLDRSELNFYGVARKAPGDRLVTAFSGRYDDGDISVSSGEILLRDTRMSLTGSSSKRRHNLVLTGNNTGLDGIRSIMASHIWRDLKDLSIIGLGDVNAVFESVDGEVSVAASINAFNAAMGLRDFWVKPQGEHFQLHTKLMKSKTETKIEKIELIQGRSRAIFSGEINAGEELSGVMRADLDVESFLKTTPGLAGMKKGPYRISDALTSISDKNGIAEIHWTVSGTAARPRMEIDAEKMPRRDLSTIVSRQLGNFTRIFFSPVQFGTTLLQAIVED